MGQSIGKAEDGDTLSAVSGTSHWFRKISEATRNSKTSRVQWKKMRECDNCKKNQSSSA